MKIDIKRLETRLRNPSIEKLAGLMIRMKNTELALALQLRFSPKRID